MKTEIPEQDGWYWIKMPFRSTQMAQVYRNFVGAKIIMVMSESNPTGFTVYYHPEDLEGAIFTKIEVPI
jgi:hypothetical protein